MPKPGNTEYFRLKNIKEDGLDKKLSGTWKKEVKRGLSEKLRRGDMAWIRG